MKYLVTYVSADGVYGNVSHIFQRDLPTEDEISNLMKEISDKGYEGKPICILNLHPMYDKEAEENDPYAIFINNVKVKPKDYIETLDENGHCMYFVEFGQYRFNDVWHVGWYLKLDQFENGYPEDKLVYIRPMCDLDSDTIKEFKLVS